MDRLEREYIGRFTGLDRRPVVSTGIKERPTSVGVAVLIVGLDSGRNGDNVSDPLIWTISELKSKFETSKTAGQISIPAETRKEGESMEDNILGALGEFCDDTVFASYVKRHMVKMDDRWYRERGVTMVGEKPADVAVLIYDGAIDFPFKPTFPEEVSPNGWIKKSELVADPRLRDVFRQVLELDNRENLIRDALESYSNNPDGRRSVFPEDFNSIRGFSMKREFGIDREVLPRDYLEVFKRLPEARRLIVEAIDLLAESQSQEKRDYKRENKIVSELEKLLRSMECYDYAVGIGELDGLGIRTVGVPIGGFKSWGERRRELVRKHQNPKSIYYSPPESYRLAPPTAASIENKKSWGSWELQRGDELGYPKELGRDWYLVFHNRSAGNKYGNYGIAPISGIRGLKLRPYDAYGM